MSEKVIQFTRVSIPMVILSLLIIAGGLTGIAVNSGFNLGIDFLSGINLRLQIAKNVLKISYDGNDQAVINISDEILQVNLSREGGLVKEDHSYILADYATVSDLAEAVSSIEGIKIEKTGDTSLPAATIIGLNYATDLTKDGIILNCVNLDQKSFADISDIRALLGTLGNIQIQTVGKPANQEFMIRMQDQEAEKDFNVKASSSIVKLLEKEFGVSNIIVKQTDYVGPRFSEAIGYQSVYLTGFALFLILIYIWFRFKLAYAVSAITALVHDVLVMIGVIGTFRIEVNTATIAAVLTIIGYSLNDTIVIFDRIRENQKLLRDKDFVKIINISITQSLSRTLITSLTTLLAVVAIYFFGSGMIKIFALNLIVGVVVGTYSSIFIASPVLLGWVNIVKKRSVDAAEKKYAGKMLTETAKTLEDSYTEAKRNDENKDDKTSSTVQHKRTARKKIVKR